MFWLILVFSSTLLGYSLIPFAKIGSHSFLTRFFGGWLLGSALTWIFFYLITIVIPICFISSLLVSVFELVASFALLKRSKKSKISFGKNPWFSFLMLFTAGASLSYLGRVYRFMPYKIPHVMLHIYDDEVSFINSVLIGCNKRHLNPFSFQNPRISGFKYHGYAGPLLFTASLMSLTASYSDASIVICFMNIMATCYGVYRLAQKYTKWTTMSTLMFLFSGSWAAYIYLRASNRIVIENDLIHQFTPTHMSVWYQPFTSLLALSKSASYSIAMAQFALIWSPTILSQLCAILIPNVATSFSILGVLIGLPTSYTRILISFATLLFRLNPFVFTYKPLFREAEMRGTFFAPFIIWFIALGPVFLVLLFFGWKGTSVNQFSVIRFACIGPFLLLQFFREGTDHFCNSIAIAAAIHPIAMILFTDLMRRYIHWPKDEEYRGCAIFIATATFAFLFYGCFINANRIIESASTVDYYNADDQELISFINKNTSPYSIIWTSSKRIHPIIYTGRQAYLGDRHFLWGGGIRFQSKLNEIDEMTNPESDLSVFQKYGISYIIKIIHEESLYGDFNQTMTSIFSNKKYRLFSTS